MQKFSEKVKLNYFCFVTAIRISVKKNSQTRLFSLEPSENSPELRFFAELKKKWLKINAKMFKTQLIQIFPALSQLLI